MTLITLGEHRRIHADMRSIDAITAVITWEPRSSMADAPWDMVITPKSFRLPRYADGIALNTTGAHF